MQKTVMRKLSFEFSRDIYKDGVARCILPGKIMLEGIVCWPDKNTLFMRMLGWFLFYNLLLVEIFHAAYVFKNLTNIGEAVSAGTTVTSTMEGLVRIYIMLTKREVINRILVKVWKQFWPIDVMDPTKQKEAKRQSYISIALTSLVLLVSGTCTVFITSVPYLTNHGLVVKSVFPFDWSKSYVYELIYIWQHFNEWLVIVAINGFDFFFIALVTICYIQFIVMQQIFRSILTEDSRRQRVIIFGKRGETMTDREMLFECLEHHNLLTGICSELEESFNIAILIQFFVSTTAICAACLVLKLDYSQFTKMMTYVMGHLSQLFYYCLVGQELSYQSGHLGVAIYECNWHLSYDRNFRKALVLMIQRSQRVQCLTAVGITELNYESFIKILKLSFSFYTLLNNLLAKNMDA